MRVVQGQTPLFSHLVNYELVYTSQKCEILQYVVVWEVKVSYKMRNESIGLVCVRRQKAEEGAKGWSGGELTTCIYVGIIWWRLRRKAWLSTMAG